MMFKQEEFTQLIESGSELQLYFVIDTLGAFIWNTQHAMSHDRIPANDDTFGSLSDARKQSQQAVAQCVRFGVTDPIDSEGRGNDEYWLWYRWWDSWKKQLSDKEWRVLNAASSRGNLTEEELAKYRPNGTWKETVAEQA